MNISVRCNVGTPKWCCSEDTNESHSVIFSIGLGNSMFTYTRNVKLATEILCRGTDNLNVMQEALQASRPTYHPYRAVPSCTKQEYWQPIYHELKQVARSGHTFQPSVSCLVVE